MRTSIAFTGDISFSKYMKDGWKKEDLLDEKIIDFLHSSDHVVANVECALSKNAPGGTFQHTSDPAAGGFICKKIGADIWTIANNHILDCQAQGVLDTLQTARENGCQTIGAGENKKAAAVPVVIEKAGGIGIFSTVYKYKASHTPEDEPGVLTWDDEERIRDTIRKIKETCRWCVLVVHGGRCEFAQLPLLNVREKMRSFLDLGVDIVVGHHPHVVQNYERFGKKMIFYSLGNFIFDTDYQRAQNYTEYGMLLKLHFTEKDWNWEYQPILVDRENHRVVAGQKPAIFTQVGALEYRLLLDLNYADFMVRDRKARMNANQEKYRAYTDEMWLEYDTERLGKNGARRLHRSHKQIKWKFWKLARKELYEYIGKDLIV